jgi:two-component sensor histidine kinase
MPLFGDRLSAITLPVANRNRGFWQRALRYGAAVLAVVAMGVIRWVLPLDDAPYLVFMPGMFVIGFMFGLGPGLLATLLSALVAEYITLLHADTVFDSFGQWLGLILYILICAALVAVCDFLRQLLGRRRADLVRLENSNAEQKKAEAQQQLLNHELAHRLKNTLAMVQAIANQTLRRANNVQEARLALESRLIALGTAQDVLTNTKWESAELDAIVRNALVPHGLDAERFTIGGPVLRLSSRCALALSLALHELATNAAKYGALSVEGGMVKIGWDMLGETVHFHWLEQGGPAVTPPERTGFGSILIEKSLAGYFRGTARIEYAATGVRFALEGPVTRSTKDFTAGIVEILAV